MPATATTARPFVWYELLTSDPKAAKGFYGKLLGWGTEPFDAGSPEAYEMWTKEGKAFGGLMKTPPQAQGAPPHWLGYVGVEDVDRTAKRVEEKGGKVHVAPTDIPNAGRFAIFQDPQGALIAVHGVGKQAPEKEWAPPKAVSWHELSTDGYQKAWDFYADLFGWHISQDMDMGEGQGVYRIFGLGPEPEAMIGGISDRQPDAPPPSWLYYLVVEDLDGKVERTRKLGGKIMLEPMEVPGGSRIAIGVDPQGAGFGLHERAKE